MEDIFICVAIRRVTLDLAVIIFFLMTALGGRVVNNSSIGGGVREGEVCRIVDGRKQQQ
jgi:hypothetical protein